LHCQYWHKIILKFNKMTSEHNFANYGDIVDMHDTHAKKTGMNTIAWILGIIGVLVVLAVLWNTFVRKGGTDKTVEKETNVNLGENNGEIRALRSEVAQLKLFEREDALKIAYTDGTLFGGKRYYDVHYPDHCYGHGHGCGERRRGGDDCNKSSFRRVTTFTPGVDSVEAIQTCG